MAGAVSKGGTQSAAIGAGQAQADQDLAPFADTGVLANTQQANLLGLNGQPLADQAMSLFEKSPGYQFQFDQGLRAIDAGAASTGILRSGATIKAEQAFGTGLADKDFGDYVSRLNALSTTGANAATGQAGVATGAAGARSNIAGSEASGVTNSLAGLANNQQVQNKLADYFQPSGSSIYGTPQAAPTGSTAGQAWAGTF